MSDLLVEFMPLRLHVYGGALADGALVCGGHEGGVAVVVEVVAAGHGDDFEGRGEHVVETEGTV